MPYTPTPQTFVQAQVDAVTAALDAIIAQIIAMNNTNTALTKEERKEGVTVGVKRQPYNDFYYESKNAHPLFKPGVSDTQVPELDADKHYFIHKSLAVPLARAAEAVERMSDMQLNSEHFAFDYSNEGRNAAHRAKENGKPGADSWSDSLDNLYPDLGPTDQP